MSTSLLLAGGTVLTPVRRIDHGAVLITNGRIVAVDQAADPTSARMVDDSGNAGSVATMDRLVQVMVQDVGVALQDAVAMAATVPARIIGVDHRKGILAPGMDGDVVVLTEDLHVSMTVVAGRVVYRARRKEA